MPFVEVNDKNIHYNITGKGDYVILLHNGFYSTETWDCVREELSKDFTVIDYDRYGYGKSDKFIKMLDGDIIKNYVYELESFVNKLNLKSFHLCGHCLGGAISLFYAINNPDRVKKIIAESVGYYTDFKITVKSDWTFQSYDKMDNKLRESLQKMHGLEYSRLFWELLCDYKNGYIMKEDYDILDDIKKVKNSVLIINGDNDFYFGLDQPIKAFKKIKNANLWVVPNTGHDVHIENSEMFIYNIRKFLKKI